jgi:hypothetical protein
MCLDLGHATAASFWLPDSVAVCACLPRPAAPDAQRRLRLAQPGSRGSGRQTRWSRCAPTHGGPAPAARPALTSAPPPAPHPAARHHPRRRLPTRPPLEPVSGQQGRPLGHPGRRRRRPDGAAARVPRAVPRRPLPLQQRPTRPARNVQGRVAQRGAHRVGAGEGAAVKVSRSSYDGRGPRCGPANVLPCAPS